MNVTRALLGTLLFCLCGSAAMAAADPPPTGDPWFRLRGGLTLAGVDGSTGPVALTVADIDGDGSADLLAAFPAGETSRLVGYPSNLDARAPYGARARARRDAETFDPTPLLPGRTLTDVPVVVDLLAAGDLDGDGRGDGVAARRGDPALWWWSGGTVERIPVPGAITSLAVADLDRRDGRDDVLVATVSRTGASLTRLRRSGTPGAAGFETTGLLRGDAPYVALAAGRLDRDGATAVAAAAGRTVTVVRGDGSGATRLETFDAGVRALAFGSFDVGTTHGPAFAVLLERGAPRLLRPGPGRVDALDTSTPATAHDLVALNLSNRPGDDLLVRDPDGRRLWLLPVGDPEADWVEIATPGVPAAVIPLHVNDDPFADLAVAIEGADGPTLMATTAAQVHTVDSTDDDGDLSIADGVCATATGACTLRAAIEQSNATAATDTIVFGLSGTAPFTIQPLSALPAITEPLLLDATTQPGYAGMPVVELDGSLAGGADGLVLTAGSSSIRGLGVVGFEWSGIVVVGAGAVDNRIDLCHVGIDTAGANPLPNLGNGIYIGGEARGTIVGTDGDGVADSDEGNLVSGNGLNGVTIAGDGTDGNVVAGNHIGTDASGVVAVGNGEFGAAIYDLARQNRIGTDGNDVSDDHERNVLSGNAIRGALVAGAEDNVIAGNYIGTDVTGTVAVPNVEGGVEFSNGARFNLLGSDVDGQADLAERNVVSGNDQHGIQLFGTPGADDNVIAGNWVGLRADGGGELGNGRHGILVNTEANRNRIGGFGVVPGICDPPCNHIAYNGTGASLDGVRIAGGVDNAVIGNVIHDNEGGAGIDIARAGPTPNDPGDPDGDANNSQNFPMLTEALTSGDTTTVTGVLDSLPDTTFHLELYANAVPNPSGFGEGESLIATHRVTTDGTGHAGFTVPVTPAVPAGHRVTSTATRLEPGDVPTDTSEFSACIALGPVAAAGRVPDGHFEPGQQLILDKGEGQYVILSWGPSCLGSDVDYAIFHGTLGDFTSHVPRVCSTGGLTTKNIWEPVEDLYYLVAAVSGNREGSYGFDGDGVERPVGPSTCFERSIGSCP